MRKSMRKSMQNGTLKRRVGGRAVTPLSSTQSPYLVLVSQTHISTTNQALKTARRRRYADARPDLRRKRQPDAHAVPCISETAEKSVKYTVFVEVTPWMEPKGAKSEPKGAKRERKGAKMETKSIKNPSKWFPKPTRAPRSILDSQNGTKTDPKRSEKDSKIYAKSLQKSMQKSMPERYRKMKPK